MSPTLFTTAFYGLLIYSRCLSDTLCYKHFPQFLAWLLTLLQACSYLFPLVLFFRRAVLWKFNPFLLRIMFLVLTLRTLQAALDLEDFLTFSFKSAEFIVLYFTCNRVISSE